MNLTGVLGYVPLESRHPVLGCASPEAVLDWCNQALASELVHVNNIQHCCILSKTMGTTLKWLKGFIQDVRSVTSL